MPELPDVESFKRYFDATALHQTVAAVSAPDERILHGTTPQQLGRTLNGVRFEETRRHGKFLFARASSGGWLVLHFGMTGELLYQEDESDPPEYAKAVFRFEGGGGLFYVCRRMLGRVGFADSWEDYVAGEQLGPDALAEELDVDTFVEMVRGRRGQVKSMLMDQSFIAGVGNVYSDEVLFQASLHPTKNAGDLDPRTIRALYRTMRRVLRVANRRNADTSRLPRTYMLRSRSEGAECPKCGGTIETMTAAGRTAYYCPKCQPQKQ